MRNVVLFRRRNVGHAFDVVLFSAFFVLVEELLILLSVQAENDDLGLSVELESPDPRLASVP